ncbi:hypothetical protein [uncultured Mucilaginibacter sp.]|uniref:hypothetical protein n=1 Tax=uncultured Mucilaginibacter sp. TaxID=797541 RepID=UPI0025CE6701|nr:hypothetical protein [uncultured Mucilaginibacter sp.]
MPAVNSIRTQPDESVDEKLFHLLVAKFTIVTRGIECSFVPAAGVVPMWYQTQVGSFLHSALIAVMHAFFLSLPACKSNHYMFFINASIPSVSTKP